MSVTGFQRRRRSANAKKLDSMRIQDLRSIASAKVIPGVNKLTKLELIEILRK